MSRILLDLALSRGVIDRAAHLRQEINWSDLTRIELLVLNEHKLPLRENSDLHWLRADEFDDFDQSEAILLGQDEQTTYAALLDKSLAGSDLVWESLREVGAALSAHDVGLATAATALSAWHKSHQFCNRCGSSTTMSKAGWARRCIANDHEIFPRTEPAVIVAVEDTQGRILLGRRVEWAEQWFSTLAGFVEAGESAEATVVREVAEESGALIDPASLRYLGSQPWPFPASLMLGYRATALTTQISPDPEELAEVRWFTRAELAQECASGRLRLPSNVSVAWRLVEDWYGEVLPVEWSRQPQVKVSQ